MTTIINKSSTADVYGSIWQSPPPAVPNPAWTLKPGQQITAVNADGSHFCYNYVFPSDNPGANPYYQGWSRVSDIIDVHPGKQTASMVGQNLTQAQLAAFKLAHPNNQRVQNVTLESLIASTNYNPADFRGYNVNASRHQMRPQSADCAYDVAIVVVDCIFALTGAVGLAGKISSAAITEVKGIIAPSMNALEEAVHTLSAADGVRAQATAIKEILHIVWSGSMIEAVYHAVMNSLEWWDMVLYSVLGLATITGAFLTDGAAILAMIVAEMALCGFIISDAVKAVNSCGGKC